MSERPHRCRTWAPRGQTPVLQYHFNWKSLSAMAGVSWWNFYFRLFPGAVRGPQVVEFLRHLRGRLLIIWDGLRAHRSRVVWDFVRRRRGRLWLEFLPAYAPEMNPVEYLWSHWKQHELANFCPHTFAQLSCQGAAHLPACAAGPPWSWLSGSRRNCFLCNYIMQSSIVCAYREAQQM